ncbi:beta-1,3-glucosyltransferase [Hetaerina americana]|uniref:beta-1,3-glucosyltransferase n=1 Tax=Hetaerina americana TaxID=62018 RepID=UPI003A7F3213
MSQGDTYNAEQAHFLKDDILLQAQKAKQSPPIVHLFHEDFLHPGAWTILPIITKLHTLHGGNSSWVLFLESRTRVNLPVLLEELSAVGEESRLEASRSKRSKKSKRKVERGKWVGHALHDREPTIIHHFQSDGRLSYPHFSAGFAMDRILLHILSDRVEDWASSGEVSDFSIDAAHELASFIWNSGQGAPLTHSRAFCLTMDQNKTEIPRCATWPLPFEPCGEPESPDAVYFAVKTCSKFHAARLSVVKRTWARYSVHINYFSDTEDPAIPSINLGIPNTEHGHCAKTKAILQHVSEEMKKNERLKNIKWVVLVDDDTILSVARLLSLLSCFPNKDKTTPIVLGERYGYRVSEPMEEEFPSYSYGYNYATGGGGVVLNREAVRLLSESDVCVCPAPDAPDDMVLLGVCLSRLGISVTHSPSFHQARPLDYPAKYLKPQHPVSFHKHWMIDPVHVYREWFAASDQEIKMEKSTIPVHHEL